jgi:formate hydrogenlyase subunit 3/multisubunit Na+/H+ antiporter MnhD subunit
MNVAPSIWLEATLAGYALGAAGSLVCLRRERAANALGFGLAALAALCGLVAAVGVLAGGVGSPAQPFELMPSFIPNVRFTVRLDPLSAFFLLLASLLGLAIAT